MGIDRGSASDQDLWSQAANEHAGEAFGELFERHADRVYAHCFSRTGSWSMAEDLTSVVFLEAWRRREEVRFSGDSALPWLLGVANNATAMQRTLRRHNLLLAKLRRLVRRPTSRLMPRHAWIRNDWPSTCCVPWGV